MKRIATHQSGTGEASWGITCLATPFKRCQRKTLLQQFMAGARYFDLRVSYFDGELHFAHGKIWWSKRTMRQVLLELDSVAGEDAYISVTYERQTPPICFITDVHCAVHGLRHIVLTSINKKKPWTELEHVTALPGGAVQDFRVLDLRSWHSWLPIPWLWHQFYTRKHQFNSEYFVLVDFL